MKIGLISDTHIPDRLSLLPENVIKAFEGVDLILHAGDVTDYEVIEKLEKIAPVLAVEGNMDRRFGRVDLPKSRIIKAENQKIGILHGDRLLRGDMEQLAYNAMEMGVNILISGHTHIPHAEKIKDIILINPGSPTVPRSGERTVATLEINSDKVEIEFVKVWKNSFEKKTIKTLNFKKKSKIKQYKKNIINLSIKNHLNKEPYYGKQMGNGEKERSLL